MSYRKAVRFAEQEEHISIDDEGYNFQQHDQNPVVHIAVPPAPWAPLIVVPPTPSTTTLTLEDDDNDAMWGLSTPSSATLPGTPSTHRNHSPGSLISTPSPTLFIPLGVVPPTLIHYPTAADGTAATQPPQVPEPHRTISSLNPRRLAVDLSIPLLKQDISTSALSHPAIANPPPDAKQIDLFCEGFPWKISVKPVYGTVATITVQDVFDAIYECLNKTVVESEYHRSFAKLGNDAVERVTQAWRTRDPAGKQRLKRIDFLLGRTHFQGIQLYKDDIWKLYLG